MSQKPIISKQDTANFLRDKLNFNILNLTPLSGGEWSQALFFIHNNKKYVLRWSKSSEGFEKDSKAYFFNCNNMPIPKIIDTGDHLGVYYAVSEFAEGRPVEELSSPEFEEISQPLIQLLSALRDADISNSVGYGGWDKYGKGAHDSWKKYLLNVKNDSENNLAGGWWDNLNKSSIGTKNFDQLYFKFKSLVNKCPESRELIHSDLLNKNLLVSNSKISAVIDWQCSLYGDSLYEIAWFAYNTLWHPQIRTTGFLEKALIEYKSSSSNLSNIEERMLCYQIHIGLGSIAYNSFKKNWEMVEKSVDFTQQLVQANLQ